MCVVVSQESIERPREASAALPAAGQPSSPVSRAVEETLETIQSSFKTLQRLRQSILIPERHLEHSDFWRRAGGKMSRAMVERHLAQAERHVVRGRGIVAEQRERVARLERDGHDVTQAKELLRKFEELQAIHVVDRDSLRNELLEHSSDA